MNRHDGYRYRLKVKMAKRSFILLTLYSAMVAGCCADDGNEAYREDFIANSMGDAAIRTAETDFKMFVRSSGPPFFYATTEFTFRIPGVGYRPEVTIDGESKSLLVRPLFYDTGPIDPEKDEAAMRYIEEFNAKMKRKLEGHAR